MVMRINSIMAIPTELKPRYLQRGLYPIIRNVFKSDYSDKVKVVECPTGNDLYEQ
jgi:hypothetical protein